MVSTSSKIALVSICPRIVYLINKYGNRETKESIKGEMRHELFAKDVEKSMYAQQRKGWYAGALIVIILTLLLLGWLLLKGVL
ncbi:MAG: hypothetical protein AB1485_05575 [Candidatus Thermoplasmatota archaeon]